ncbi:EAL domain-containing protein [Methylobacterium sp. NEAU 140]|uniref:sensor domain-containing phosphodiesterase n=1 Tax=Methylobacterium sp. NEAU 140 TaxID=3064945 RepID=UPI0027348EC5|nr:EAL domain-containing protein [Methylobacterium sp. NEAU 140]MDP4023113.1 EAL domain-containing protein [Methylobacterium sp. NEAU 140]
MSLATMFEAGADSPGEQIRGILRAARRHLAMDVGFVSEFVEEDRIFRFSDGETLRNPIVAGASDPLEESFCHYVARGLMPQLMRDAAEHPVAAGLPVTRAMPVGAHLAVPLRHADGTAFGSLCCFSFTPDHSLTTRDLGVLRLCAEVVTAVVEKDRRIAQDHAVRRQRIADLIAARALTLRFQPIYSVSDGRLTGFEALTRFTEAPQRSPDVWFAEAAAVGLGTELEFLAVETALAAKASLDPSLKLTVNLSPASVVSPRFAEVFAAIPLDRVVVELTEHAVIADYDALRAALAPFRARGLRLAIDDVGAGHSTFRHVLDLAPEFIKLDRSLIQDLHADSARRALAEALTSYGRRIGCEVVAEGVETPAEYAVLRAIGVTRAQGFLLGAPMPLEEARSLPLRGAPLHGAPLHG